MKSNNKTIVSDFKEFLDSKSIKLNGSKLTDLFSFSLEISNIDITNLINFQTFSNQDFFYWKIQNEKIEFLALKPLINFHEFGEKRLNKTCSKINEFENKFHSNWDKNKLDFVPLIVGGIKFAPDQHSELWNDFSDSDWFIPSIVIMKNNGSSYLLYNFFRNIDSDELVSKFQHILEFIQSLYKVDSHKGVKTKISSIVNPNAFKNWEKIVDEALFKITEGLLTKVVLSREVNYKLEDNNNLGDLLKVLSDKYPGCYSFAYKRKDSLFLGASPEKLAKISNNWIEVDALAGSVPRGRDEIEDLEMEKKLLSSEKNLFEQRAVVNFIHNLLLKVSNEIIFDDKPVIRKLPNIQHLWTIIRARLNNNFTVLNLLMKLHPTPAICGTPWKIAKDFILEMEPHDRGLYSGNIGWFNYEGCGEFAVGIRTALIKDNDLFAYAGCGIVEGSEAKAEYEESEIKLKPIRSLFVDEKIYQP